MTKRLPLFLLPLFALVAAHVSAQTQTTTYDGCVDASGGRVPAVVDTTIANVVETRTDGGTTTIRYNPQRLPRLLPASRDFLFAHECARVNLGLPAGPNRTEGDAREADCEAVATLLRSGLLDDEGLGTIEADLALSADEWRAVPGPQRAFALRSCASELARRPSLAAPPAAQADWNACVRNCGETLRTCRSRCTGTTCTACSEAYERCTSLCDFR